MKDIEFIKRALVEINKFYNIRNDLRLKKHVTSEDTIEDKIKCRKLILYLEYISIIRSRFYNWSKVGPGNERTDESIVYEITIIIQYIDIFINHGLTNYKYDKVLNEIKTNLESLIVFSKLASS